MTKDKLTAERMISEEIFYSSATNGKAQSSITKGEELILNYGLRKVAEREAEHKKELELAKAEGMLYQLEWDASKNPLGLEDEYYHEIHTMLTEAISQIKKKINE